MSVDLLAEAQSLGTALSRDRRSIHQNPELAYKEYETSKLVTSRLASLGIEYRSGVAGTGVVGLLAGVEPGPTLLLRADMDALEIHEKTDISCRSQNAGVMHACGHDAHTAILLGTAQLLKTHREEIHGNVKLVFQPAEEEGAGALQMINEGLLDDPVVDAALMLHVSPGHSVGQVAIVPGAVLAGSVAFTVVVRGNGGHASAPHSAVDPIVVAAVIINVLQTLVSREQDPQAPAVVTVASIHAGTTNNAIPDEAVMLGTIRAFARDVLTHLQERLEQAVSSIANAMRATAVVQFGNYYPPSVNDQGVVAALRESTRKVLGSEKVLEATPLFASEDFSFILERVPGAMFDLGVRGATWPTDLALHSASFDLDESALPIGVACLLQASLDYLDGRPRTSVHMTDDAELDIGWSGSDVS